MSVVSICSELERSLRAPISPALTIAKIMASRALSPLDGLIIGLSYSLGPLGVALGASSA